MKPGMNEAENKLKRENWSILNLAQPISYKRFSNAKVLLQAILIHRLLTSHFQIAFEGLFLRCACIQTLHQALWRHKFTSVTLTQL